MNPLVKALLDFFFPPLCHICHSFVPDAGAVHICPACRGALKSVETPMCPVCGMPFQGAGEDHLCGDCSKAKPYFDAARAAFLYEGGCRELIHAFKYRNKTFLRRPLALMAAAALADFVSAQNPDVIVPVPLHKKRLRSRGFNQAVLLGELLAHEWRLPLERRAMSRIRWTIPQVNLSAAERRHNVKGAFAMANNAAVAGKRVLLLDDILTTGSTVEECSRILKCAGASEVVVITIARAVMR